MSSPNAQPPVPLVGNIKVVFFHHMGGEGLLDVMSGQLATLTLDDESPAHDEDDMVFMARGLSRLLDEHPFSEGHCFTILRVESDAPFLCSHQYAEGGSPASQTTPFRSLYRRILQSDGT